MFNIKKAILVVRCCTLFFSHVADMGLSQHGGTQTVTISRVQKKTINHGVHAVVE